MKHLIFMMIMFTSMGPNIIFEFNQKSDLKNWVIIDDVVMGGESSGSFELSPQGHGVFKGSISLDNNGGFSSVRHKFERKSIKGFTKIVLKIKGDGKKYQFRIKSNSGDYYSYISTFSTNGDWQEIQITLKNMYPSFRGRKLDKPSFSEDYIEEIVFLIGNKIEESFQLQIDKIELK
ncbi:MAG: NADH dehydrogenase [ubiquinone] 1 alpha subcomplex assembly factor 1 [Sphingobacteriales bacterium]|jgi:NADH dehydrogenase [ubiquinone] 1 alpha subcomplex assembly factor 1